MPQGREASGRGYEEVLFAQRIGVQELRPHSLYQRIRDDGLHFLSPAGNLLHNALRFLSAPGRIDDQQPARAGHAVVAGRDAHHLGWMVRDRPRVEEGVGKVGIAAVVLHLRGTVRVHVEQDPRVGVG